MKNLLKANWFKLVLIILLFAVALPVIYHFVVDSSGQKTNNIQEASSADVTFLSVVPSDASQGALVKIFNFDGERVSEINSIPYDKYLGSSVYDSPHFQSMRDGFAHLYEVDNTSKPYSEDLIEYRFKFYDPSTGMEKTIKKIPADRDILRWKALDNEILFLVKTRNTSTNEMYVSLQSLDVETGIISTLSEVDSSYVNLEYSEIFPGDKSGEYVFFSENEDSMSVKYYIYDFNDNKLSTGLLFNYAPSPEGVNYFDTFSMCSSNGNVYYEVSESFATAKGIELNLSDPDKITQFIDPAKGWYVRVFYCLNEGVVYEYDKVGNTSEGVIRLYSNSTTKDLVKNGHIIDATDRYLLTDEIVSGSNKAYYHIYDMLSGKSTDISSFFPERTDFIYFSR